VLLLWKVFTGAVVGFLVGMTGMGGGAVTTPLLILVFKMDPVLAVGTDLAFSALTKISGGWQHIRQNSVGIQQVLWMSAGSLPASWLGARFVLSRVDDPRLTLVWLPRLLGGVLIVVAIIVLARVTRVLGPHHWVDVHWPPPVALFGIGALGGLLVGVTSVGGGTVIMALLLIFFSIPLSNMVGLDVVHGAVLGMVSATAYVLAGQVDWATVAWLLLGSIPGAVLGAWASHRVSQRWVRGILGCLLIGIGLSLVLGR